MFRFGIVFSGHPDFGQRLGYGELNGWLNYAPLEPDAGEFIIYDGSN